MEWYCIFALVAGVVIAVGLVIGLICIIRCCCCKNKDTNRPVDVENGGFQLQEERAPRPVNVEDGGSQLEDERASSPGDVEDGSFQLEDERASSPGDVEDGSFQLEDERASSPGDVEDGSFQLEDERAPRPVNVEDEGSQLEDERAPSPADVEDEGPILELIGSAQTNGLYAELDLHGYFRQEAKDEFISFLRESKSGGLMVVAIITGHGKHSEDNIPVIKPMVGDYLLENNYRHHWPEYNPGIVYVVLKGHPLKA